MQMLLSRGNLQASLPSIGFEQLVGSSPDVQELESRSMPVHGCHEQRCLPIPERRRGSEEGRETGRDRGEGEEAGAGAGPARTRGGGRYRRRGGTKARGRIRRIRITQEEEGRRIKREEEGGRKRRRREKGRGGGRREGTRDYSFLPSTSTPTSIRARSRSTSPFTLAFHSSFILCPLVAPTKSLATSSSGIARKKGIFGGCFPSSLPGRETGSCRHSSHDALFLSRAASSCSSPMPSRSSFTTSPPPLSHSQNRCESCSKLVHRHFSHVTRSQAAHITQPTSLLEHLSQLQLLVLVSVPSAAAMRLRIPTTSFTIHTAVLACTLDRHSRTMLDSSPLLSSSSSPCRMLASAPARRSAPVTPSFFLHAE
eukprot:746782-Hanusia_phi.AAC.1